LENNFDKVIKREVSTGLKTNFSINEKYFSKPKYNSFKSNKNTIKIDPDLIIKRKNSNDSKYWNDKIDFNSRTPIKIFDSNSKSTNTNLNTNTNINLNTEKIKIKLTNKFN
jgi:hypothetical protein